MDNRRLFAAARRASGLTVERAAEAAGVSCPTMRLREARPGTFRLRELMGLHAAMDDAGRELLREAVRGWLEGEGGPKDGGG